MTTKFKKPIALLLAVTMAMLLNFPSGLFASIGIGLTAKAENNTCDHAWGENITRTIDPTCTEGGYDVYACEKCGTEKRCQMIPLRQDITKARTANVQIAVHT